MSNKIAVLAFGSTLVGDLWLVAPNLGTEFIPRLSEGAFALGTVRLAGTSLLESVQTNTRIEKALLAAFPKEIDHVWSRVGTAGSPPSRWEWN